MGSLLGTIFGTILNKKRGLYVHRQGSLNKATIDSSSHVSQKKVTMRDCSIRPGCNMVFPT